MSTRVVIESPVGTVVSSRNFAQGQDIRIGGKVKSFLDLPEADSQVTIQIYGPTFEPMYFTDVTNLLGDFWIDAVLPYLDTKATIEVFATHSVGSPDQVMIPIAIGNALPDPLPVPQDQWGSLFKTLMWVGVGLAAFYIFINKKGK